MSKKVLFLAFMLLTMIGGLRSQNVITIEGNQSATTSAAPFSTFWNYSYTQMIYTNGEMGGECDIYGIGFHAQSTNPHTRYVQIWLAPHTGSLSSWNSVVGNGAKLVYSGPFITGSNAWSNVTFTSPFHHEAGKGLLVVVNDVTGDYTSTTNFYANTGDSAIYSRYDVNYYIPYSITSSNLSCSKTARPDVKFYTTGPVSNDYATVTAPFVENFEGTPRENDSLWRSVNDYDAYWTMENVGSDNLSAGNNTRFAKFFRYDNNQHCVGSLISPLVQANSFLRLSFSYICPRWSSDLDTLKVYYRTSTTDDWHLLKNTSGVAYDSWTNATFDIPSNSAQVKFEARTDYGYGIGIDNVSFEVRPLSECVSIDAPSSGAMGTPITFTAVGPENATYQWTFPNATPATATGQTVNATWNNAGEYTVLLVATLGTEAASATKTVTLLDCSTVTEFPFEESFEIGLGCWTAIDADGDGYCWSYYPYSYAHTGDAVLYSASYDGVSEGLHPDNWIISPKFHLPNLTAQMSWWERVHSSGWPNEHYGLYISTTGTNPEDFTLIWEGVPLLGETWNQRTMLLNPYCGQDVYIAFRHFNTYNQWALDLDDIVVDGTVGIEDFGKTQVSVWPNPTTGLVNISSADPVKTVEVYNVQGSLVKSVNGESTLDLRNQPVGVYIVRVTTENTTSVQRVVLR
ncbi:MAG: choice-of-anchor J domain-containing protein [Bacteroidales bacterium]|nr:choice-of-anchor J domain-containing protein [Bacteroidales bacterium]